MNNTVKVVNDLAFVFEFQPRNTVLSLFLEGVPTVDKIQMSELRALMDEC